MCVECLLVRSPGASRKGANQRAPKGRRTRNPRSQAQNPSLPWRPIPRLYCPCPAWARIVSQRALQRNCFPKSPMNGGRPRRRAADDSPAAQGCKQHKAASDTRLRASNVVKSFLQSPAAGGSQGATALKNQYKSIFRVFPTTFPSI